MGWVTDINFQEGLGFHGVQIEKGFHTQVRWDLGIGGIDVGADGQIKAVYHNYPLEYLAEAKAAYEKDLLTFTGILDGNASKLHFHKGQLLNVDLFYGKYLESYVMTQLWAAGIKESGTFQHEQYKAGRNLDGSLGEMDGEKLKLALEVIRQQLDDSIVHQHPDIDPEIPREALAEYQRKGKVLKNL
jgi:hypothetical protein